jgi:hypothetical protein
VEAPATFHRAIDRDATAPEILLDSKRIEETLRLTGLLFLVKKLFERSQVGHFQFARVGIVLETNRISVHYETRRYEAERQLCSSTFGVKVLAS